MRLLFIFNYVIMKVFISDIIRKKCPDLHVAALMGKVKNSRDAMHCVSTYDALWQEIEAECDHIIFTYKIEDINKRPAILATRKAYKALGKDPNRYRPSAEALCRRIVRGLPLYRVSTLVDLINLVSLRSGFSIGGFDADKIQGDEVVLNVGTPNDVFEAIGRGLLNIDGMPVYRDAVGGIGTPTSDNERTKISEDTTNLLMLINGYNGMEGLDEAVAFSKTLLEKYAFLTDWEVKIIGAR